jgi:hypothetical protein
MAKHVDRQRELALQSQYGDLYNEIVRPERKYTISHYLRTQWAPLLGAARLWFVIALRQRCFWNNKQDWCIVDKKTLAKESGLSLRTVNRIISAVDRPATDDNRDDWTAWFFSKTRRRRYNRHVGRAVNAPNRYHVLLDDPLTPAHQAALTGYLLQHTGDGSPESTLHALQTLCACSDVELYEILSAPTPESAPPHPLSSAFVLDVVRANCPLPAQESALYVEITRAASRLHNAITTPERVYVGNQYFRLKWLPEMGPVLSSLVINLRARCYWNERTGELRDTCQATWAELARELGCTSRQLRNLRQAPQLSQFITTLSEGHGRALSRFRVRMFDPLTDPDSQRFEAQAKTTPDVLVDPETGQLDMYPLLTRAEDLAPVKQEDKLWANKGFKTSSAKAEGTAPTSLAKAAVLARGTEETGTAPSAETQAERGPNAEPLAQRKARPTRNREGLASSPLEQEISASSDGKIWHIGGIKAEVLADQPGKTGTTDQLLVITPTLTELVETTIAVDQPIVDKAQLLAAVQTRLLANLGIQEPNRGRIVARNPRCDWIVAWGLYALTQAGLSQNRAGYICNRLWNEDPPPSDLLEVAGLSPPEWRLFQRARAVGDDTVIPGHLYRVFGTWRTLLGPVKSRVRSGSEVVAEAENAERRTSDTPILPRSIERLLSGHEQVQVMPDGVTIVAQDLYQAWRVAQSVAEADTATRVSIAVAGPDGQPCPLNGEVLALGVDPLPVESWEAVWQELQWQMDHSVFARWWQGVKPLGVLTESGTETLCVVLGVPSADVRSWIEAKHMPIVRRTMGGVLGRPVEVRFAVYGQPADVVTGSPSLGQRW